MSNEILQSHFNEAVQILRDQFADDQALAIADAIWYLMKNVEQWESVPYKEDVDES